MLATQIISMLPRPKLVQHYDVGASIYAMTDLSVKAESALRSNFWYMLDVSRSYQPDVDIGRA
jgi:hypothetical protein